MDQFYLKFLSILHYRCFESLDLKFEPDVTIIFAENAGGKTAILQALAILLGMLQPKEYKSLELDIKRDARRVSIEGRRPEALYKVRLACWAMADDTEEYWKVFASVKSPQRTEDIDRIAPPIERLRAPERRWPLIAYDGTGRMMEPHEVRRGHAPQDRMDGYDDCLSASTSDKPLLDWLRQETFGDLARKERREPERGFWRAVTRAMETATPGLSRVVYDPATDDVWATFSNGDEVRWGELSDGYHVFLG
jgi:predicted ATP-binding protein involved in virulence